MGWISDALREIRYLELYEISGVLNLLCLGLIAASHPLRAICEAFFAAFCWCWGAWLKFKASRSGEPYRLPDRRPRPSLDISLRETALVIMTSFFACVLVLKVVMETA